jgi:hypothetical protein
LAVLERVFWGEEAHRQPENNEYSWRASRAVAQSLVLILEMVYTDQV